MIIEKLNALKVFYYLMSVDGVTAFETEKFDEIGSSLIGAEFFELKEVIMDTCQIQIDSATVDEERYDVILEGVDQALDVTVEKISDGVVPRLLVWDLLSIANCDDDYSEAENRLIAHVVRKLLIEKSIFLEMKQLISTMVSIQKEQDLLEQSDEPYAEIRPLIEEVEKRKKVIIEAAMALIADDVIMDEVEVKEHALLDAGKKVGGSVAASAKNLSDSVVSSRKKIEESVTPLVQNISGAASKSVSGVADGAGKLFGKLKDVTKKKTDGGEN